MQKIDSEIRQNLLEIIENFSKTKSEFDFTQRKYIENRIKVFKTILKNPNTEYYFDENGELQLGRIIWDYCRYCMGDLKEMRDAQFPHNPKNAERFCSKSCTIRYSEMKKKVDDYEADFVIWGKDFLKIIFHHKCSNASRKSPHWPLSFELPVRSTRAKNFKG